MRTGWRIGGVVLAGAAALAVWGAGCNPAPNKADAAKDKAAETDGGDHGWWCKEHGMPEKICVQCHPELAGDYKKKKDWGKEHDRPESQCLICHPELKAKFAARYRAKYGIEPPPLEESDKEKKGTE